MIFFNDFANYNFEKFKNIFDPNWIKLTFKSMEKQIDRKNLSRLISKIHSLKDPIPSLKYSLNFHKFFSTRKASDSILLQVHTINYLNENEHSV